MKNGTRIAPLQILESVATEFAKRRIDRVDPAFGVGANTSRFGVDASHQVLQNQIRLCVLEFTGNSMGGQVCEVGDHYSKGFVLNYDRGFYVDAIFKGFCL